MTASEASPEPAQDAVTDSGNALASYAGVANSGIINGDVTTEYHAHHYPAGILPQSGSVVPPVPRIRRRALITAVSLLSASAAGVLGYTALSTTNGSGAGQDDDAPNAGPTLAGVSAVPVAGALIEQDFAKSPGRWPQGAVEHGVQHYAAGGGYHVRTTTGDSPVWVTAPVTGVAVNAIRLTATATVHAGNSGWGLWYHNTITGTRYEFSLTHDGSAYIKIHGGPTEKAWEQVQNFTAGQKNGIVAECRATQQGVQLDLTINGERRSGHVHQNQLLGRGTIGIHAFHFKHKEKADIQFHDFTAVRL